MFILRSEQVIAPTKQAAFAVYQARSVGVAKEQPGFLWDLRLTYLGNYDRRLIYQAWETRAHRQAYSRGEDWIRAPEGLLVGPALSEFYEVVTEVSDRPPDVGHYVLDRHFRISNGRQEEFEALETGLCELAKGRTGFVSRSGFKFLGNDTSYVRLSVWQSWEALDQWVRTPEYAVENDAILSRVVWTTADRYAIVSAVAGRDRKEGAVQRSAETVIA